jgi:ketosteroid isomerase-like protein
MLRRVEAAENNHTPDDTIAMMAEDVVLMVPDFEVQEGREACARFIREMDACLAEAFDRRIRYVSTEVRVLGDVAFDRGTFAFAVLFRDQDEARINRGKFLILYVRSGHEWKISRLIVSRDDPEELCDPAVAKSEFGVDA